MISGYAWYGHHFVEFLPIFWPLYRITSETFNETTSNKSDPLKLKIWRRLCDDWTVDFDWIRRKPSRLQRSGRDWDILNHQCHQLNVRGCDGIYIVGSHEIEIQGFLRFQGVQVSAQSLNWRCSRQTGLFWDPMELILAKNVYDMRHIGISYATKLPRIAAFFM